MNLNKILASSCRRRILKTLAERRGTPIMRLVHVVNSTYNEVDRNLGILESEGILTQRRTGHKRIISLNFRNEKTLVLLKLLKIRENTIDLKQFRRNLMLLLEKNKENSNDTKH